MRHAKSDWNSYQEDFDRPISRRGVADLGLISPYFAKLQRPNCILCSPALRTKQTLEILRETLGKPLSLIKIDFVDSLYLASSEEIENQIPILGERNRAVIKRLIEVTSDSENKQIAIFYGGAHMPGIERLIIEELGYRQYSHRWLPAWRIP